MIHLKHGVEVVKFSIFKQTLKVHSSVIQVRIDQGLVVNLISMGLKQQSQNRAEVDYTSALGNLFFDSDVTKKTFSLRASLAYKGSTLEKKYFIDSEPKGEVISSKIDRLAAI